ncbi:MAG: L-threonylcarbamoyladenylate synthase [Sphingomonadaceae bacterium]
MADASHPSSLQADAAGIARAAALLAAGQIVAVPTETVYGLAADAANPQAVAAIFAAKGRPSANPLIVHVADLAMARRHASFPPLARRLAAHFWPGPLTLVLPRKAHAPLAEGVTAGLATVALRVPAHPAMQGVIRALGRGVAAPSANVSGRLSPTRASHVRDLPVALILDAGPCEAGLESTILKVAGEQAILLRPGALARETIEAALGEPLRMAAADTAAEAPGMAFRHYAPRLPVHLGVTAPAPDMFLIGFGAVAGDLNLSPAGNLEEAGRNLFAALHAAEASGATRIGVAPIPETGLGVAIADRLRRAAEA